MKKLLFIPILLLFISCKEASITQPDFSWLSGKWQRVNDQPGKITLENWYPIYNGNYIGHGYTLQKNDTIFQENLVIKPENSLLKNGSKTWVLEVTGVNEIPTIFHIKKYTQSSFIAVNLKNEFPTHIEYFIITDSLKARVYNDKMSIDFTFNKL